MITNDNVGILNGTQVYAPIQAPVNLCGVAAAIGGTATAGCEGGSAASLEGLYDVKMISTDNTGVLNGTQVFLPVQIPVNVCGVAVAALGDAAAGCEGGASATMGQGGGHHRYKKSKSESVPAKSRTESTDDEGKPCTACPKPHPPKPKPPVNECPPDKPNKHHQENATLISKGNVGILNGTQVYAPIQAPVNVSSISAAVLGQAWSASDGGSSAGL